MSDLDKAIAQLRSCRPIPETQVRELCYKARELLIEEGNVVTVNAPVTVRRPVPRLLQPFFSSSAHAASDMRRHSRPVPRLDGAVPRWR